MVDQIRYVPILRWKAGEKGALGSLHSHDKAGMTPLIEWSRPGEVSPKEDREGSTPSPRELVKDILKHWGPRPFFCDLRWFVDNTLGGDLRILQNYARELSSAGTRPIPVIALGDADDFRQAIAVMVSQHGLCLRVSYQELIEKNLPTRMSDFMSTSGLSWSDVDIVFDFGTNYREIDIPRLCSVLAPVATCRSFTVAAGSFPMDLRRFKGPQTFYLPREEWVQWLNQTDTVLTRRPNFGDYSTIHPVLTMSQLGLNPSATIRYATEDYWLVMKGEGLRNENGPGYAQYKANAMLLIGKPEYAGADFSAGDRYIKDVADGKTSLGNPTTWIRAGVNHHMTLVVRQVAEVAQVGPTQVRVRATGRRPDPWSRMWEPQEPAQ